MRAAAPNGIDAFIDLYGPEYLHLAVTLGVSKDRINTVVFSDDARKLGVRIEGAAALDPADVKPVLLELADLLATGVIEMPIAATYPLEGVADAFEHLERGHSLGKIVLLP